MASSKSMMNFKDAIGPYKNMPIAKCAYNEPNPCPVCYPKLKPWGYKSDKVINQLKAAYNGQEVDINFDAKDSTNMKAIEDTKPLTASDILKDMTENPIVLNNEKVQTKSSNELKLEEVTFLRSKLMTSINQINQASAFLYDYKVLLKEKIKQEKHKAEVKAKNEKNEKKVGKKKAKKVDFRL